MMKIQKFPVTPSIAWGNTIEPQFKTYQQKSENGMRKVLRKWIYPEYKLSCEFKVLTEEESEVYNDLNTIMGFFMEMSGSAGVFLWKDSTFNHMHEFMLGIGDGYKTTFQLSKQIGGFIEPVLDVENLSIQGTTIGYTVNEMGQVVFERAIPRATRITATYDYYWRVAFANDKLQFQNFYKRLWSLKKMELVTVK